jgi:hypothetical protein
MVRLMKGIARQVLHLQSKSRAIPCRLVLGHATEGYTRGLLRHGIVSFSGLIFLLGIGRLFA